MDFMDRSEMCNACGRYFADVIRDDGRCQHCSPGPITPKPWPRDRESYISPPKLSGQTSISATEADAIAEVLAGAMHEDKQVSRRAWWVTSIVVERLRASLEHAKVRREKFEQRKGKK
jgi:hypothetical protein